MSIKRTTIIFVCGVALAAWLSAAMNPGRAPAAPAAIRPAPIDATGAVLSGEIARLRERLRPDAAPRQATRNPFVFRSPQPRPSPLAASPTESRASGESVAPAATLVAPPTFRLSLAGIAEEPDAAGGPPVRTAIVAGNGQVTLAKEGDTVTDGGVDYKVGTISADSAELIDVQDGGIHRLTLK